MKTKIENSIHSRLSQGDIYRNIEYIEYAIEKGSNIEISKINFPYVVVLTQDCDLEQDHINRNRKPATNEDKKLFSIIVAPIYNAEHFFLGEHLLELNLTMMKFDSSSKTNKNNIITDQNQRYHFLSFPDDISVPDSIVDFKHYFTVNIEYLRNLKNKSFVCSIKPIYRELLLQRFSNYLSRIGLPSN